MRNLCLLLIFGLIIAACDQNNPDTPEPTDFGFLSLNISVSVTSEPTSGRTEAVSTDEWRVTIFSAIDDSEVAVFDPFIDAPAEVQLPTGEYYVEAHSNNFEEAAFENPYYFGRSDNFTIDKEELKTINIDAELANSKVAINYSSNVTSTFDAYTGEVTVVSTGATLPYVQGETREGYFVAEPLSVVVDLSYTKLDGTFITRMFTADIDAQPKTLYNINVDATLEDGEIMININVDETFDTEEINIGDVAFVPIPDPNTAIFDSEVYPMTAAYIDDYGEEDPLEISVNTHFGYQLGFSDAPFVVFTETTGDQYFVGTNGASFKIYFEIYAPEASTFINGTFNWIDDNTATLPDVDGELILTGGEIEFDDDGILDNGDFEDAEFEIIGGSVTISGSALNYTVDFNFETDGGQLVGNYSGDFDYLDNTDVPF